MFARVITVQAGPEGLSTLIDVAERQLPEARLRPGLRAFYLLTDKETGELITVSFWDTREQIDAVARGTAAGIHDQGTESATSTRLGTFEVMLQHELCNPSTADHAELMASAMELSEFIPATNDRV